ncbi:MAG TPA: hypothetical protein VHZ76_04170 [Gammaproteobacteria bacterium]|nr:hypothetical protein [Gammaproteobacteria bacterium]
MNKKLLIIAIFFIFVLLTLIAIWLFSPAKESESNIIKNLQNQDYAERSTITKNIHYLAEQAKHDEYRLSIVLLASAQQGDEKIYRKALLETEDALNAVNPLEKNVKHNSYIAWLLGRMLIAADSIEDKTTITKTLEKLKRLLADNNTKKDAFTAWGWGYLAALNKEEYSAAKNTLFASAAALSNSYQQTKRNIPTDTINQQDKLTLQTKLSDALWAWVMAAYAAANAQDTESFYFSLQQMQALTGQTSTATALTSGLKRLSTSNDYPAWALSIIHLAAATIKHKDLYLALEKPLVDAIQGAKESMHADNEKAAYNATAEATLAQLGFELARKRMLFR